jgi:hypothetical protein
MIGVAVYILVFVFFSISKNPLLPTSVLALGSYSSRSSASRWPSLLSSSSSLSSSDPSPQHSSLYTTTSSSTHTTLRICQNKHCRKRTQHDIVQTVHNLLDLPSPPSHKINIESSGCLSQCDKGPNIEVEVERVSKSSSTGSKTLLHGMKDAQTCASQFNLLSSLSSHDNSRTDDEDVDDGNDGDGKSPAENNGASSNPYSHLSPPKVLIAASKVVEQSETLRQNEEKILFLSSVIDTLDAKTALNGNFDDTGSNYKLSAVYACAYALRAQTYVEMNQPDKAISDAQHVVVFNGRSTTTTDAAAATPLSKTLSYRAWVDAEYLKLDDDSSRIPGGMPVGLMPLQLKQKERPGTHTSRVRAVLQQWWKDQPSYRLKIEQELKNLE